MNQKLNKLLSDPRRLSAMGAAGIRDGKGGWKHYIEFCFRDEKGTRIKFSPHQQAIFDFIERKKKRFHRLDICAPWGHGKTQSLALFYPLWIIGKQPKARIKIISAKDAVATVRVAANRLTIEENTDYNAVFPQVKRGNKWGEQAFRIAGGASGSTDYTMEGYGVGSGRMGGRCDYMIHDDVCDMDNSLTEDQRTKTREKIQKQWLSRLSPDGRVISIRTPWHPEDAMEQVTKMWQKLKIVVSEDIDCLEVYENNSLIERLPLWEEQWSAVKLQAIRNDNYKLFNMGYRLKPPTESEATFKHVEKAIRWNTSPSEFEYVGYWGGVDLSGKTRPGTVAHVGGVTPDNKRVVVNTTFLDDAVKLKGLFKTWYHTYAGKFNFAFVENNALQSVIVDMLKGESPIPVRGFLTGKNKHDIYHGLPVLDTEFENGRLIIPVPHGAEVDDNCPTCRLIRALRQHPFASETDSVMALWFVRSAMMSYGTAMFV